MTKQFSPSFERNKQPIFEQLCIYLKDSQHVLEIGSGSGQHATFFAPQLSHLNWQTSDMPENHASIEAWVSESTSLNLLNPIKFTVGQDPWPNISADTVFTANTTHIMQPKEAQIMMEMVSKHLPKSGVFCQYGPMRINGEHTSDSNKAFDESLKEKGFGGIRDITQLKTWAEGMELIATTPMPANNFLLIWKKL